MKHEEEHPLDDQDDDDPGEDRGGGDGGDHDDERGGGDKEPSDDSSDEGPPAEFMQPKPKSMPKQPAPFLTPEAAASGSERPPAPPDHPPGVPQPRHGPPPSDHHFRKMAAGFWIDKAPPPMRTSGDYRHVPDPIMCLELCLRKALLFTFKITIALALIL